MTSHADRTRPRYPSGETPQKQSPPKEAEITSLTVLLARLVWIIGGPMVLFVVLAGSLTGGGGWLTRLDAVYAVVVALTLACRWLEQRSGRAQTASGEPSSAQNFRIYSIGLILGSAVAWVLVKMIANLVLHH